MMGSIPYFAGRTMIQTIVPNIRRFPLRKSNPGRKVRTMKRKQLTVAFVRSVKPEAKARRYQDGYGLMLVVRPGGYKGWIQRVVIQGRRRDIGLGSLDRVSLAQARRIAFANRNVARDGGDPTEREEVRTVPNFEAAAEAVIAMHAGTWSDRGKTEARWRATLATYAFPRLGRKSVADVTASDVLAVLMHKGFWNEKRETARKIRQRVSTIMDWAVAQGHRADNPCVALKAALPKTGHQTQHQRALPYDRVSDALSRVRASAAYPTTKLAFEFLVLTAARSGEVRGARWDEVDMDARIWTVPLERTKTSRPHRVPLSDRTLEVLREAAGLRDHTGLVFPSARGLVMSDMTISKLVKELGIEAVPHGFRSSFRMWAAELTSIPREVAEFALGHVVGDEAERAYQRSDLFERRVALMDAWARYLAAERGKVTSIKT